MNVGKTIKQFKSAGYQASFSDETGMIHFIKDGSKDIVFNAIVSDCIFGVCGEIADSITEAMELAEGVA
ncbi:MAG: hypothetical protein PWR12_2092 [Eubacteriaceae bacterium]|nr:hypothetical protein [Eubacteriaceae bacterium]MDK2961861.1 hypothetical protein [Eubacteriaceae bacterium]MDN5289901.1 hypothetical protein [Anaerophaga sp.]